MCFKLETNNKKSSSPKIKDTNNKSQIQKSVTKKSPKKKFLPYSHFINEIKFCVFIQSTEGKKSFGERSSSTVRKEKKDLNKYNQH